MVWKMIVLFQGAHILRFQPLVLVCAYGHGTHQTFLSKIPDANWQLQNKWTGIPANFHTHVTQTLRLDITYLFWKITPPKKLTTSPENQWLLFRWHMVTCSFFRGDMFLYWCQVHWCDDSVFFFSNSVDFGKSCLNQTWNPKQPSINGCFNWMIPNLYIENGCFTKHPFINGCLGFQELIICSQTCSHVFSMVRPPIVALGDFRITLRNKNCLPKCRVGSWDHGYTLIQCPS